MKRIISSNDLEAVRPQAESSATRALETAIETHPFLAGLTSDHLRALKDNALMVSYQPGEVIFREGVGPGDVLGWSWLLPPYYWHFDARAVEPTEAIFFYGTRLRQQCEDEPDLGYELLKRMSAVIIQRLQATRKQLLDARARV